MRHRSGRSGMNVEFKAFNSGLIGIMHPVSCISQLTPTFSHFITHAIAETCCRLYLAADLNLSFMPFKHILYSLACLSFAVVIGAAIYEHIAVVPQWSAAPPASLSMFQGKYGLNPAPFWMYIHPVTLVLFITSLIFFRKTNSRKNLLITLTGYVIILIITFIYFVPELLAITGTSYSENIDVSLAKRAQLWEKLSLVRLGTLIVLAIVLFLGLTKPQKQSQA
ncbi:MAG TPA: hypothetical protein VHM26_11370 [Chitinophagaceae bacterium]|jgi:hypothetical protein|nr:hypothetical protein [Chitinophagaceae bacterium]